MQQHRIRVVLDQCGHGHNKAYPYLSKHDAVKADELITIASIPIMPELNCVQVPHTVAPTTLEVIGAVDHGPLWVRALKCWQVHLVAPPAGASTSAIVQQRSARAAMLQWLTMECS
jgi:hypothetical protein